MRVAVCQMNAGGGDVPENVATAVRLLEEAADGGADLAALPELWPANGSPARMRETAEPIPGSFTDAVAAIARARSMWIVGGSVAEAADDLVFNTSCLFDRDGEIVARYRKIHLFDVDLPGEPPLRESAVFSAGEELVTYDTDLGRIGLSICYDVRFPELYRGLMTLGAEIVCVPSARALGGAAASAGDRGAVLHPGARAVGTVGPRRGRPPDVRELDRGRSVGRGARPCPT